MGRWSGGEIIIPWGGGAGGGWGAVGGARKSWVCGLWRGNGALLLAVWFPSHAPFCAETKEIHADRLQYCPHCTVNQWGRYKEPKQTHHIVITVQGNARRYSLQLAPRSQNPSAVHAVNIRCLSFTLQSLTQACEWSSVLLNSNLHKMYTPSFENGSFLKIHLDYQTLKVTSPELSVWLGGWLQTAEQYSTLGINAWLGCAGRREALCSLL